MICIRKKSDIMDNQNMLDRLERIELEIRELKKEAKVTEKTDAAGSGLLDEIREYMKDVKDPAFMNYLRAMEQKALAQQAVLAQMESNLKVNRAKYLEHMKGTSPISGTQPVAAGDFPSVACRFRPGESGLYPGLRPALRSKLSTRRKGKRITDAAYRAGGKKAKNHVRSTP